MAGQIKKMIDRIVSQRAKGNETLANITVTKLILRGIRVDDYDAASPDDPSVIDQLRTIASDLSVQV